MSEDTSFQYAILKYTADTATGEYVNVGLAMFSPAKSYLRVQIANSYARLTAFFPTMDGQFYSRYARSLQTRFEQLGYEISQVNLIDPPASQILPVLERVLPPSDGAFYFSEIFFGAKSNLDAAFEQLYARLVTRHQPERESLGRDDDSVWQQTYKKPLQERGILPRLRPHTIVTPYEQTVADHSWRNGSLNVLYAVSFDLVQPRSIIDKAKRWLGNLETYRAADEPPTVHLLLGQPRNESQQLAYKTALRILSDRRAELKLRLVEEQQAESFAQQVSNDLDTHSDQ